jgi:hypothetical protein
MTDMADMADMTPTAELIINRSEKGYRCMTLIVGMGGSDSVKVCAVA